MQSSLKNKGEDASAIMEGSFNASGEILSNDVIQEIVAARLSPTSTSEEEAKEQKDVVHDNKRNSNVGGIIGRRKDRTDLLDDDDGGVEEGEDESTRRKNDLIIDTPSTQESLHMTRPTDEELVKIKEKKRMEEEKKDEAARRREEDEYKKIQSSYWQSDDKDVNQEKETISSSLNRAPSNQQMMKAKAADGSIPSTEKDLACNELAATQHEGGNKQKQLLTSSDGSSSNKIQKEPTIARLEEPLSSDDGTSKFQYDGSSDKISDSANSHSTIGAHRVRGIDSTNSSREFTAGGQQWSYSNLSNYGNNQNVADEENPSYPTTTCGGAGGVHCNTTNALDLDLSATSESTATLITAAEVVDDSSEELRRKSEVMEREIEQRIIKNAVEANVVLMPVLEDDDEEDNNAGRGRAQKHRKDNATTTRRPTTRFHWIMAAVSLILGAIVIVMILVTFLPGQKEEEEQQQPEATEMSEDITNLPTTSPSSDLQSSFPPLFPPDDEVVAQVETTICYERIPHFGSSQLCPDQELGSAATNLVAASRLLNFPEVDLSILNAGEVKTDIKGPGNFTVLDARHLLPYSNTLVLLQIQGKQLIVALERALQKLVDDYSLLDLNETMSGGAYPYGAGIRYHVNMSQSFPNRLSNIEVNPQLAQEEWTPIDTAQEYTIVTSSYLAGGGDGYNEFNRLPPEAYNHTELHTLSGFLSYCHEVQILQEPPLEYFSTQSYTNNHYNWSCNCHQEDDEN